MELYVAHQKNLYLHTLPQLSYATTLCALKDVLLISRLVQLRV